MNKTISFQPYVYMIFLNCKLITFLHFQTKECSRIGGSNLYEFIKRCQSLIMSNKFASEFSWRGAKKKKIFGHLKLAEQLLAASELNYMANNRKEAEEAVKKWLKRAKERDVAESKRNNNGIA